MSKTKSILISFFSVFLFINFFYFPKNLFATKSLSVSHELSSDTKKSNTYPLSTNNVIYHLSISGQLRLKNDNSLARVVLIDNSNNEYLVSEAYPLIVDNYNISFTNTCEETCLLNKVKPKLLRIELENASLDIKKYLIPITLMSLI